MAWVEKRGGARCWVACWKMNGRKCRRSTGIPILQPGKTARNTRQMAEHVAVAMELAASGETPSNKACEAVRKAAEIHGMAGKIPTVREYLDAFPHTGTESTKANRRRAFRVFIEYLGPGADRRIDTLTPAICLDFIRRQLGEVSRATAEMYKTYIGAALRRAVDIDDFLLKNPMRAVSLAHEAESVNPQRGRDAQTREPFTLEELAFMIANFPEPWCDMVAVCWYTAGLRLSDVCLLRWDAVDWKRGFIQIVEKKTKRRHYKPLIPELKTLLQRRLMQTEAGEPYVFPEMARYYMRDAPGYISTQFTALLRAHGMTGNEKQDLSGRRKAVSKKSFHSIRHSVVTYLRGGMTGAALFAPDVVREVVGHESEAVERGYFSSAPAVHEQACRALAAALHLNAAPAPPLLDPPAGGAYDDKDSAVK